MSVGHSPADDLFSAAATRSLASGGPLAARMRPRSLDEMVGQAHLLRPGAPLRVLIDTDRLSSAILWGSPGTGKTSLARIMATTTRSVFVAMSAVSAGVREVREVLDEAKRRLGEHGERTVLFLDEVHRFNRAQQDVLLEGVEDGLVIFVGATTENPFFALNAPLMSRSSLWRLEPLGMEDLAELARRGLKEENATAEADVIETIAASAGGDGRALLTTVETAARLAHQRAGPDEGSLAHVERSDVEQAAKTAIPHYGADEHYDIASAFIKSIRGSDPDAGLYWLARMLNAGEDPRFVARRLVILSSEDIGMADSNALVVAEAAARSVDLVGMPEAALNLAHAVVHLACAPKSNRVTMALAAATADATRSANARVPVHLRDAHYKGARVLSHGQGYIYPHDADAGDRVQVYLPEEVAGAVYYEPGPHGREPQVRSRLEAYRPERVRRGEFTGGGSASR